ncbi:MAG: BspA family leucine-rich repeat surface protein, partial [Bacteroidales bacterium]|nr:BspA family leucine-rich repeat surface protein [Bacteroidales bacterium]
MKSTTKFLTLLFTLILGVAIDATAQSGVEVTPVPGTTNQWQFTMPGNDVRVRAVYKNKYQVVLASGLEEILTVPAHSDATNTSTIFYEGETCNITLKQGKTLETGYLVCTYKDKDGKAQAELIAASGTSGYTFTIPEAYVENAEPSTDGYHGTVVITEPTYIATYDTDQKQAFASLSDALLYDYGTGVTKVDITLTKAYESTETAQIVADQDRTFTIDLTQGLTGSCNIDFKTGTYIIKGDDTKTKLDQAYFHITSGASLTINGGDYGNGSFGIQIGENQYKYMVINNEGTLNISGGKFFGQTCAMEIAAGASTTLSGGRYKGGIGAIKCNAVITNQNEPAITHPNHYAFYTPKGEEGNQVDKLISVVVNEDDNYLADKADEHHYALAELSVASVPLKDITLEFDDYQYGYPSTPKVAEVETNVYYSYKATNETDYTEILPEDFGVIMKDVKVGSYTLRAEYIATNQGEVTEYGVATKDFNVYIYLAPSSGKSIDIGGVAGSATFTQEFTSQNNMVNITGSTNPFWVQANAGATAGDYWFVNADKSVKVLVKVVDPTYQLSYYKTGDADDADASTQDFVTMEDAIDFINDASKNVDIAKHVTIKLLADWNDAVVHDITIPGNIADLTIDLKSEGKELKGGEYAFTVSANSKCTILGDNTKTDINATFSVHGTLTIDGGKYTAIYSENDLIYNSSTGTLSIKDGIFQGGSSVLYSMSNNVKLYGGEYSNGFAAIRMGGSNKKCLPTDYSFYKKDDKGILVAIDEIYNDSEFLTDKTDGDALQYVKVGSAPRVYALASKAKEEDLNPSVLTLYYGLPPAGNTTYFPNGYAGLTKANITTAVFDESLKYYHPTTLDRWFASFTALTSITGWENINCDKLGELNGLFYGCTSLEVLDLRALNTSNVTEETSMNAMSGMFENCKNLKTIFVDQSNWVVNTGVNCTDMFAGCESLIGGNGTKFNSDIFNITNLVERSKKYASYAVIDALNTPGYLTDGNVFKIFYRGVVGNENKDNPASFTGEETTDITIAALSDRAGSKFVGWKQTWPQVANATTATSITIPAGSKGHREFTAVWESAFKITYLNTLGNQTTAEFDNLVDAMTPPSDISATDKKITVQLLRNYTSPSSDAEAITIPDGYTYNVYFNSRVRNSQGLYYVPTMQGSYDFTINGTLSISGDNDKTSLAGFFIVEKGSLTINGGTYKFNSKLDNVYKYAIIRVSDPAGSATIESGIFGETTGRFGLFNAAGATSTIKGGRFIGLDAAVQNLGTIKLGELCRYHAISKDGDTEIKTKITSASPYNSDGYLINDKGNDVNEAEVIEVAPNFAATFKDASGTEQTLKFLTLEEALNDLNYNLSTTSGEYTFPDADNPVTITQLSDDENTLATSTEPLVLGVAKGVGEGNSDVTGVSKYVLDLKKITFNSVTLQLEGTLDIKDITATDAANFKGTANEDRYGQLNINGGTFNTVSLQNIWKTNITNGTFSCTGDNVALTVISVRTANGGNVAISGGTFKGGKAAIENQTSSKLLATGYYYFEGEDVTYYIEENFNAYNLLADADNDELTDVTVRQNGAYVVYKDGTLTFKYGVPESGAYPLNKEYDTPGWIYDRKGSEITTVQFDETFASARPTSCSGWFAGCTKIETINLSNLNTSETIYMDGMFQGCTNLKTLTFTSSFKTDKVTNMSLMFASCPLLTTLDLTSFNTAKVTNMMSMFATSSDVDAVPSKLTTILASPYSETNKTGWTTDNVPNPEDG